LQIEESGAPYFESFRINPELPMPAKTVQDITQGNVELIAEMEAAFDSHRTFGECELANGKHEFCF
jgi:hypothetical protein